MLGPIHRRTCAHIHRRPDQPPHTHSGLRGQAVWSGRCRPLVPLLKQQTQEHSYAARVHTQGVLSLVSSPHWGEGGQGDCGSSSTPVSPVNAGKGVCTRSVRGSVSFKTAIECAYISICHIHLFLQLSSNVCSPSQAP